MPIYSSSPFDPAVFPGFNRRQGLLVARNNLRTPSPNAVERSLLTAATQGTVATSSPAAAGTIDSDTFFVPSQQTKTLETTYQAAYEALRSDHHALLAEVAQLKKAKAILDNDALSSLGDNIKLTTEVFELKDQVAVAEERIEVQEAKIAKLKSSLADAIYNREDFMGRLVESGKKLSGIKRKRQQDVSRLSKAEKALAEVQYSAEDMLEELEHLGEGLDGAIESLQEEEEDRVVDLTQSSDPADMSFYFSRSSLSTTSSTAHQSKNVLRCACKANVHLEQPSMTTEQLSFLDDIHEHLGFKSASGQTICLGKRRLGPPRNASRRGAYHQLIDAAKFVPRGADAYWNMKRILEYGCLNSFGDANSMQAIPQRDRAEYHASIFRQALSTCRLNILPVLQRIYNESATNPVWNALCERMAKAARDARTQDTNTFKNNLRILLPVPGVDFFCPPIEQGLGKAHRGLAHPQLRLLMMPWKDRILFPPLVYGATAESPLCPQAQILYDRIVTGTYQPSSKYFPSFCYPEDGWNPEAYQENLFTSVAIIRGIRLLLISRSGAAHEAEDDIAPGCLASIHNMRGVTAHVVAYVVVQIRLSISSLPQWTTKESKRYKFPELYQKVVAAFDDDSNPDFPNWGVETLEWLTKQVFGDALDDSDQEASGDESEDEAIAQRRKRASERVPQTFTHSHSLPPPPPRSSGAPPPSSSGQVSNTSPHTGRFIGHARISQERSSLQHERHP
ncbi:hypothetical protein MIND_01132300 [Mycena indigotica]|uniref:Uncharacterized protein n=1 Tax=Mycena indigotica TaxID=2126181 RepID=A0A8H6S616_9AGAR|nr:uncharacterized protein MIND_01132300 [Mycena indigotica]KAF7293539.1 hypothetical protein MIND_01132300 [Mycena indigotica]